MQQLTMNDIGRDIHDGVGQRLTLASIYTKQLASKEFPEEMQLKISEINLIINESLQQLRTFSRELTNEVEHELELNEILQSEIEKIRNLHVCDVESNFPSAIFLSNKKAMFLIRIVQEFFQNSLKYAECKTLFISVSKSKDSLELMLKDDGKGFDVNKISQGIGLKNIKRRAEMIQASIELKSDLNVGTSLNLKLPLE
jgi:signal transduction histidine kinase